MERYVLGNGELARLNSRLTDSVAGLVVADFDGDGHADIRSRTSPRGRPGDVVVSSGHDSEWRPLHVSNTPLHRRCGRGIF